MSVRVVDAACVVFAVWTLACHTAVALGASLVFAAGGFVALGALALVLHRWLPRDTGAPGAADPAHPSGVPADPSPVPPDPAGRLRAALAALGLLGILLLGAKPLALWWWSVALLGAAWGIFARRSPTEGPPASAGRGREALLFALSLGCALVALVAHRIDIDDAFYVNVAVAAADAPWAPLLTSDTLHGIPGLPIQQPVYRLHSYELWNGAISWLTGIPTIAVFHLLMAALVAALAPLATAKLLRRLSPRHWLFAVAATLWVLLASADTHRWYSNFAFVRIWQGKAVFLVVFLPLVQAAALDLARRPSLRGFLLLAAAEIAALGATSTALWAAPAAALAAAACAAPLDRRGLARLGLVALASLYLIGAGLGIKAEFDADRAERRKVTPVEEIQQARHEASLRHAPGRQLSEALDLVGGTGRLRAAVWGAAVVAWALLPAGLGRRFAIGVPLLVLLWLLNPYATRVTSSWLVGPSYWRALWALPVPVLLGLALAAPLDWAGARRGWGRLGAAAALALFALWVPGRGALGAANAVELHWPGLKVSQPAWELARVFAAEAGPGARVVAPLPISVWLPTFAERPSPLCVRHLYLLPYKRQLGEEELRWRVLMTLQTEGRADDPAAAEWFERGLGHFGVQAVFLWETPEAARTREILVRSGFRASRRDPEWEIWVRS